MDNHITLRRVTMEDLDAFQELRLEALQKHPQAYGHTYEEESLRPRQYYGLFIRSNVVMGAFANGTLIGFTVLSRFEMQKMAHKGQVWGAYVKPEFRNMELAKRMRLRLFDIAKTMGMRVCLSSIFASNAAALQVHQAVGYEEMYREKDGVRHADGTFDDVIHLVKHL